VADTFALDIAAFAKKAGDNSGRVVRKVSIDLLGNVVERTPVGNPDLWQSPAPAGYVGGRLRANWNTSIGNADTSTSAETDKTGSATKSRGASRLSRWSEGDIYIMNSLPYVREIEYTGHSSQAPAGMVRVTVVEFQSFVNAAVRSLPK
jgi:hypothetical protein